VVRVEGGSDVLGPGGGPSLRARRLVVSRSVPRIRGHPRLPVLYPARVECYVDSLRVEAQPGGFYGGWVTPEVVGPFKGAAGSEGW